MHAISFIGSSLAFLALTTATPILPTPPPSTDAIPPPPPPASDIIVPENSTLPFLAARTLAISATCTYTATTYAFRATFYGVTPDEKDYQNCEGGFLDNLRGQCLGYVMNWGCDRNSDGSLTAHGYVPMGGKTCVQDAICLSQGGLSGVECQVLY